MSNQRTARTAIGPARKFLRYWKRMGFFARTCILALAATLAAVAQDPVGDPGASGAASQKAYPLWAIEIVGNEHVDSDAIIAASGLRIGQQVVPADFQRAVERLSDTGVFESYEFRYSPLKDGYKLTLTVQEVLQFYRFRSDGFGVPNEEVVGLLRERVPLFREMVPPTGRMVDRIGTVLDEYWRSQGNDSKVIGRLMPTTEGQFEMLYQPETTIQTIAFVKFENTGEVPPLELQRRFNQVAMGVPYSEERLKELLHYNVTPLYEEKGLMAVSYCPCTTEPDTDTSGLLVTVHVEQGEPYTFGSLQLPEDAPLPPEEITKLLNVERGVPANMTKVRNGLAAIEANLRRHGYMKAVARHNQTLNASRNQVEIEVRIDAGDLYEMGRLSITGLDLITEPAVRKRWGIQTGEPFDSGYPSFFLSRVREMFDNLGGTDWKMNVNEESRTVDVDLTFQPASGGEGKDPDPRSR